VKINLLVVLASLVVMAAAVVVYFPALSNGFVWDDHFTVFGNRHIQTLGAPSITWMFTESLNGNWIPLNWLSHALVYRLAGLDPMPHHLANVVLHSLNALLAFLLFLAILRRVRSAGAESGNPAVVDREARAAGFGDILAAALGALFFAMHPLHAESVAWVTERKDIGCAFFFLLCLLAYLRYASAQEKKVSRWLLCLGLFVLALLFKPMAVTLPLVLLILDWWPLGRLQRPLGLVLLEKVPFFLVSIAAGIIAILSQNTGVLTLERVPLAFRISNAFHSIFFYMAKMVVPLDLAPLYPIVEPEATAFSSKHIGSAVLVLAITVALLVWGLRRRRYLTAAWAFYIVTLGPVLGILQVGVQAAADRYTYLPGLSLALALGAGVVALQGRLERLAPFFRKAKPVLVIFGCGLVWLGCLCFSQAKVWKDSVTLWEHQTELHPNVSHLAYLNLATAYRTAGRIDESIDTYRKAMEISRPHPRAHNGLGCALLAKGRLDEAIREFEQAIAKEPDYSEPYRNLWFAYDEQGRHDEALTTVTKAVELNPEYAEAYSNLGLSYQKMDRLGDAEAAFRRAMQLDPGKFEYPANLGTVYLRMQRLDDAFTLFEKALGMNPTEPKCHLNLGLASLQMGRIDKAIAYLQRGAELDPGNLDALKILGSTLQKAGRPKEAAACYERMLATDDGLLPAHVSLVHLYLDLGNRNAALRHYERAVQLAGRELPKLRKRLF